MSNYHIDNAFNPDISLRMVRQEFFRFIRARHSNMIRLSMWESF